MPEVLCSLGGQETQNVTTTATEENSDGGNADVPSLNDSNEETRVYGRHTNYMYVSVHTYILYSTYGTYSNYTIGYSMQSHNHVIMLMCGIFLFSMNDLL